MKALHPFRPRLLKCLPGADESLPRVLILDLHKVIDLDTTCLDALEALHRSLSRRGARRAAELFPAR